MKGKEFRMSSVGVIRCNSYDEKEVKGAFNNASAPFDKEKIKGKKIAVYFDFPPPDVTVLKEVISFLKENGARDIKVGASLFIDSLPENIDNMLKKENVQFVDFRNSSYEKLDVLRRNAKVPDHFKGYAFLSPIEYAEQQQINKLGIKAKRILKYSFLPTTLTEADYIVPVIKMKDSPITRIGGAIASILSLVPTMTRNQVFINKFRFQFWDALLEIYSLMKDKILFGVIDGVDSIISNNEDINRMSVILFSEDPLALDSVTAVLIGYRSREVESNKKGDDMGLGSGLFIHVAMYGDNFLEFRKEAKKYLRYKSGKAVRKIIPIINPVNPVENSIIDRVSDFCPTGAIVKENGSYKIDRTKCISCLFCVQLAPDIFKIK